MRLQDAGERDTQSLVMRGPISPTSAPICFQIISFIFNIFSLSADTALLRVSFIKSIFFLNLFFFKEKRRLLLVFVSCSFWSLKKKFLGDLVGLWWDLMIYVGLGGT